MPVCNPNAKINIGLDVLRRREDGYHDLESLFVPYEGLTDVLEIEPSKRFSIEILREGRVMDGSRPGDWDPMSDLTVKAYKLLKKDFPDLPPVAIRLEKRIPVGAGLGGGSADCAFALRMMDEMFDLYMPFEMLEIYAAELGSDCPFFVRNTPAFASGRGEVLEPYDASFLKDCRIEVVVPEGVSVSTKQAYAGIVPSVPEISLPDALKRPLEEWKDCVKNDFEKTVFALYPSLELIKQDLYSRGALYASMSGSGSALYGIFR